VSVPTKWQLVRHWLASSDRDTFAPMLEDATAPCCFACGWFSERWSRPTQKASWERATLERAHIIPSSLGGSDDASNVILLCAPCHRDSPDWPDPSEMARWIAARPDRSSKEVEDVSDWFAALKQAPEFTALLVELEAEPGLSDVEEIERVKGMLWESARRASLHASALSVGTKTAILRDTAARAARGEV